MRTHHLLCVTVLLSVGSAFPSIARAQSPTDGVPLILWETIVRPGRPYVISIRTCQPRGISQAEILIRRPTRLLPGTRKEKVFSREKDAELEVTFPEPDSLLAAMSSPTASINTSHGPLLVMLMEPEPDLVEGEVFDLVIDEESTWILDDQGESTAFTMFDTRVSVCAEGDPFVVGVEDSSAPPGGTVLVPVGMYEFRPLASAELLVRYDPSVFPLITDILVWDYRRDFDVEIDSSTPGELRLLVTSASQSVNLFPGPLFEIEFFVPGALLPGESTVIWLDPAGTSVIGRDGTRLDLELREGLFTVLPVPER